VLLARFGDLAAPFRQRRLDESQLSSQHVGCFAAKVLRGR